MKRLTLCLFLALVFLVGCSTTPATPPPIIQIVTQYRLVMPDVSLLENCYTPENGLPLFDVGAYANLEWNAKEKTLFEFIDRHMVILELCNKKIETLRQWYEKQKKLYEKGASEEKSNQ